MLLQAVKMSICSGCLDVFLNNEMLLASGSLDFLKRACCRQVHYDRVYQQIQVNLFAQLLDKYCFVMSNCDLFVGTSIRQGDDRFSYFSREHNVLL